MVKCSSQYTQQYYSELAALSALHNSQHTKHYKLLYKIQWLHVYKEK